jgi:leucyl-tRNA synthetase
MTDRTTRRDREEWQQKWDADGVYHTSDDSRDKFYFDDAAYTSGDIHAGHRY